MNGPTLRPWQPFYSGYNAQAGRKPRQVQRVHIAAPPGLIRNHRVTPGYGRPSGEIHQAVCAVAAYGTAKAPVIPHDPAAPLPEGLTWCPTCLGKTAEHLGASGQLAALVLPLLPTGATA